jgi:archaellum biogenesis protein FlaJ (TadC family)
VFIIIMFEDISSEDRERVEYLQRISSSKNEFKKLTLEQLRRLQELVERKDYSHNKKAHKSKVKLLGKINVRIYELEEGKGIFY